MKILFVLAWRNIWRNKRRTLIAASSVLFAVVLASALLSFAEGFQQQLVETVVRQETGYIQIQDALYHEEPSLDHVFEYGEEVKNALDAFEGGILYTVPRIRGFSLAARDMVTRPAMVTGIVPEKEDRLRNLSRDMISGEMFSPEDDFAVVAQGLAELLNLSVGDTITLLGQGFQAITATGRFRIGGIIEFDLPEQNNFMVFLPLRQAQWYFGAENRLTGLLLMIDDPGQADDLAAALRDRLDEEWFTALTWQELMPDIVGMIEMQNTVYRGIAWVFYIIIGFGIFGTILTMLYERMREFGIMLSVGMKRGKLAVVSFIETVIIGFLGVLAGLAVGFPLIYIFHRFPVELSGEMADYMLQLGVEPVFAFALEFDIFVYQAVSIFIITVLISLYGINKMLRMNILHAVND